MKSGLANIVDRNPGISYTVYIILITLILDFCMAHIFWKSLAEDRQYYTRGLRCKDPYFHHALEKNVNKPWEWAGIYPVITNSLGFRDSQIRNIPLVPDKERIVFIGDSFVEGVGPYEQTFVGIIDGSLQSRNIEVLNAGVVSYSPKLYYLKMQYLLERLGLKCSKLVVFVDVSDMQDEIVYKNYVPENRESSKGAGYYLRTYLIRHSVIGNLTGRVLYLLSHDADRPLADREDEWHGVFGSAAPALPLHYGIWKDDAEYYRERPYWYTDDNYAKWGREGSFLAKSNMEKLADLCKAHKVEMILAVYPWPEQVRDYAASRKPVLFWREFAAARKIRFIDFFPFFLSNDPEAAVRQYYIPSDVHFNEQGNGVIAKEFLKWFDRETR
jgi:hypothetical protein